MFLRFEDWSHFARFLDEKGIPNSGKVIKVYAGTKHPKTLYGRENMAVLESDGSAFKEDETFSYPGRGIWTGKQLNQYLEDSGLSELAQETVRALFRFANREETQFCRESMGLKIKGKWLIKHPLDDLDGLALTKKDPRYFSGEAIHLDIFQKPSVDRVYELVKLRENPAAIISTEERLGLMRRQLEGEKPTRYE